MAAGDEEGFCPYVDYDESLPLDQWAELNRSPRWNAFHLEKDGARVEFNCEKAPRTLAAIGQADRADLPGRSPASMFSTLKPRTRIPPHTGVSNTRLVVHLALIVPPGCGFRVGNETRPWRMGEAFVFDDTIEHEAWNESDEPANGFDLRYLEPTFVVDRTRPDPEGDRGGGRNSTARREAVSKDGCSGRDK